MKQLALHVENSPVLNTLDNGELGRRGKKKKRRYVDYQGFLQRENSVLFGD